MHMISSFWFAAAVKRYRDKYQMKNMECQKHADEVFCSGNAVGVLPVGSITYKDKRVRLMGVATPPYSPACTITMALTTGYPFVLVLTFNHHKNFKNFFGVWTRTNFYRMLKTFEASTPGCKIDGFAWTQFLLDGFFKVLGLSVSSCIGLD
ncbi:branched-chain-amino-acid aminotransferase 2, chloroplastic-like protein [Corchorus olitorius]|uniref:Branched-chain-amino-acid aminotransferase 2, chloroplastic-like protein n=2 Tax=Corchorus olitorius TaxID=93759 RepID=A0A1R3IGC7_9ROSI|nr:branched-chain-amino-acid aminotransferase 2, chloroplastic-like protein [Corchorus olitorius]